ncbi:MAG TPA: FixH family protein [Pedobacter sp.]|uniref:FixH family protein n=1 Tax=Pedobacter sp. TaxID=1411316 RepID=UPI002C511157|nr:FixH family protein [Pedobacter sp.]HMI02249.1 FixH family protein [Pedobacter sp.]
MNWGTKIIIGMLSFMSFILVLMILMFRSDTDALVENDYYEKGLKYDETYRLKEQVLLDNAKPEVSMAEKSMTIAFQTASRGTIKLVRTADQRQDRCMRFETNEGNKIEIPLTSVPDGQWKLILNWKSRDGKNYLNEQEVIIP